MQIPPEAVLLRIFIGESDRWQHRPLYELRWNGLGCGGRCPRLRAGLGAWWRRREPDATGPGGRFSRPSDKAGPGSEDESGRPGSRGGRTGWWVGRPARRNGFPEWDDPGPGRRSRTCRVRAGADEARPGRRGGRSSKVPRGLRGWRAISVRWAPVRCVRPLRPCSAGRRP